MTHIQKQLTETYENLGYSAALDFWKENSNIIGNLSPNEISILKNMMNRYCLINNDSKTAEIILSDKKEQNIDNKKITELLFELGKMYYQNVAPERNHILAEELYIMIAEQGSAENMYKLANMYKTGDCVIKDLKKSFSWLEKAALSGNKIAQFELAEMYMQGKVVKKNKEEAIKWYKTSNETSNSYDLSTMIIPEGITCIEESAFEGFEDLEKIVIPDSVIRIKNYAFKNCLNLREIDRQKGFITFNHKAFAGCKNLTEDLLNDISDFKLIRMKRGISFYICKYEVTQEIFQLIMGRNPSQFEGDKRPVENITMYEAMEFCNKLSEMVGLNCCYGSHDKCNFEANGYRLPTIGEWIYAAKGGQRYKYSGSSSLDEVGWFIDNSGNETHPVGEKKPNGYGLYDMSGNVCEWVWAIGADKRHDFMRRDNCGGSFKSNSDSCKIDSCCTSYAVDRSGLVGFRLVRTAF